MTNQENAYDLIIIGAGPGGLACAIESQRRNLHYLVIEKGCLVNSIFRFPTDTTVFSTPDLLEVGGIPFIIPTVKPKRIDLLNYYRRAAETFEVKINFYEEVESVAAESGSFCVQTTRANYHARAVIVGTGQFDTPNMLNVPGEGLEKVSHYYTEAHPYYRRKVAVIGGKNSAVEAALDLYRHGAQVTLVHRGPSLGKSVKYWIRPDIENRIREGKIHALFETVVEEIREDVVVVRTRDKRTLEIENDFVFAMTGYKPDLDFLSGIGISIRPDGTPEYDEETLESNIPGVYIAGVITAGCKGSKVFIENSRDHGKKIIGHILNGKE